MSEDEAVADCLRRAFIEGKFAGDGAFWMPTEAAEYAWACIKAINRPTLLRALGMRHETIYADDGGWSLDCWLDTEGAHGD